MAITRTPMVDDDGSGTTGTIINNAWKQEFYDQIDAVLTSSAWPGGVTGQIAFPATQVPAAGANVLDDYEEGTWSPTLEADGGQSGQTYDPNTAGRYVKVGSLVNADAYLQMTNKGTLTGNVMIGGLPFPMAAGEHGQWRIGYFTGLASSVYWLYGYAGPGMSRGYLYGAKAAGTTITSLVTGDITNGFTLVIGMTYRAA